MAWTERLEHLWTPVVLTDEQEERLRSEAMAVNRWRLQRVLPLMIVMNLFHVAFLTPDSPIGHTFPPELTQWADGLYWVHAITAVVALVPLALALLVRRPLPWLGAFGVLVYQLHAAAIAGVDQLNHGTVAPYVGYAIVNTVLVALTVRQAFVVYLTSTFAFWGAIVVMQPDPLVRATVMPTGPSVLVPVICLTWFLASTRRREFWFRETIAQQGLDLQRLNGQLKETVDDQVVSLRHRAEEVERLNRKLVAQVKDRSQALARALGQLAEHEVPVCLEGRLIAGRFAIGEMLGAGGMGVVHAATDMDSGEDVAVKFLRRFGSVSAAVLARFLREVELGASVVHPGVVRMLHVDVTDDGVLFQVQERVYGETLQAHLERRGALSEAEAFPLLTTLCEGLAAAHARGVVHRDVKPANMMLVPGPPGLKLLDFGIAKVAATNDLTATGAMVGTPAFMAPEQWDGRDIGPPVDVYAVGVTALRMLTGRLLRSTGTLENFSLDGDLTKDVAALLRACLSDEPTDRPTAASLAVSFTALVPCDQPIAPAPVGAFDDDVATHLTFGE